MSKYEHIRKETTLGDWKVLMFNDEDGHLTIHIKNKDCSELIKIDSDLGDEHEYVERLTTKENEKKYKNSL